MYFNQMWDEVPLKKPYYNDPTGKRQIRDYRHMLAVLNHIFTQAPQWNDTAFGVGMVGVPMVSIFDYVMATPSGHAAFLDSDVNKMLKKMLNENGGSSSSLLHLPTPRQRDRQRLRIDTVQPEPRRRAARQIPGQGPARLPTPLCTPSGSAWTR
ncbi:Phophatidylserine decarboxylase-domain-containing protein [Ustulina deusta]|nr:Phophatidylserine decarboxylase-domain-containing protein [Ustulina deusta]